MENGGREVQEHMKSRSEEVTLESPEKKMEMEEKKELKKESNKEIPMNNNNNQNDSYAELQ